MTIPMFSCGCLNSELWGPAQNLPGMHSVRGWALLATAVGPDLRGHETSREERGAKSIHCAGLAIAAGLHSPIRPHGPNAILQVAFTVVGHSPALAFSDTGASFALSSPAPASHHCGGAA